MPSPNIEVAVDFHTVLSILACLHHDVLLLNFLNSSLDELRLGEDPFEKIDITLKFGAHWQHWERGTGSCSHAHPPWLKF
jgi:hypothetical protein